MSELLFATVAPMTPADWRATLSAKGWRQREAALRWGYTPEWISTVARDPNRPLRFDDMLRGLPDRRPSTPAAPSGQVQGPGRTSLKRRKARPQGPGYRYHDDFSAGAVVQASDDVGSMAEAGTRAVVVHVVDAGRGERYLILFDNGQFDYFAPDDIDKCLASTGLRDAAAATYRFQGFEQLSRDHGAGMFSFGATM
jgi:hypothetical protein